MDIVLVDNYRKNSFRKLLESNIGLLKINQFLTNIFYVEDVTYLNDVIINAVLNISNKDDTDIYNEVQQKLNNRSFQLILKIRKFRKQFFQLLDQKEEISNEVKNIFQRINNIPHCHVIKSYVSIGDAGRYVKILRKKSIIEADNNNTYILHDNETYMDIIERGDFFNVGKYIPIDYNNIHEINLQSSSIDLVTCFMGFHHFDQSQLYKIFKIIFRILKPGGIFIFREHDGRTDLLPMLDVAHNIYNILTDVPSCNNEKEKRAFRPIMNWIYMVSNIGFIHTNLFEMQDNDPTEDIMLCFVKPFNQFGNSTNTISTINTINTSLIKNIMSEQHNTNFINHSSLSSYYRPSEWLLVWFVQLYGKYLEIEPWYRFPYTNSIIIYWKLLFIEFKALYKTNGLNAFSSGLVMDFVIGIIMTLIFSFLIILSVPLLCFYGGSYDPDGEMEQFLLVSDNKIDWDNRYFLEIKLFSEILIYQKFCYLIGIPRYKKFTELVLKVAQINNVELLEISGNSDYIQMEIIYNRIPCNDQIDENNTDNNFLNNIMNDSRYNVISSFNYPVVIRNDMITNKNDELHLILNVKIKELFNVIKLFLKMDNIHIKQIFEFI
jgi:SAM-dependent methyltransferase